MILVDTSVWADHLRRGDARLAGLLNGGLVAIHPFVIGEIALGNLPRRGVVLEQLSRLPQLAAATEAEALALIENESLFGTGLGYIDVHLLAAVRLTPGTTLWSRDKRLAAAATQLDVSAP